MSDADVSRAVPEIPVFRGGHLRRGGQRPHGPRRDPRLREIMAVVVKHLHAAVKEIEPTHEEWLAAIKFLTETGQMCTEWRQEFILLSDTLGVSMLVDAINHRRPSGATENTILGPFYVAEAPRYENGANICLDGKGEPMVVARPRRRHRRQSGPGRPDRRLADQRGRLLRRPAERRAARLEPARRLHDGPGRRLLVSSVKPRYYPIPDDGPVGKMLAAWAASQPAGPHPLHRDRTGLRSDHHPCLHPGQRVSCPKTPCSASRKH